MVFSNIWSQGQLFAFSALDGESKISNDFVGTLCADKIGVRFFSKIKRELIFSGYEKKMSGFHAVLSDYIEICCTDGSAVKIIYANANLVLISTAGKGDIFVTVEGKYENYHINGVAIQDTFDGQYTGIKQNGSNYYFAFAKSVEELIKLIEYAEKLDIETEADKKKKLYKNYSLDNNNPYARLYSKCLSTMKTQLYSKEGKFKGIWSTPDRLPHKHFWLWDSVFHGIGHSNYDAKIGEELILRIFDTQSNDGFIPHMSTLNWGSSITQPPIIAWGANIVYKRSKNIDFLRKVYNDNKKFLNWCKNNRRDTEEELYTWHTGEDENCRCDESGMDNSPRFDKHTRLQAIDYSCFMANDIRNMALIAKELGLSFEAEEYNTWFTQVKEAINSKLWCEEDGFYYDYDVVFGKLHKVSSVASFLPVFAGVCDDARAEKLVKHLLDPEEFYTEFPIPSISKKDATFGSDMWKGPVWINYNYMISKGLAEYGYGELSEEIEDKTIAFLNHWYLKKGTMFEFYDSENRKAPCELNRKGLPFEPYNFEYRMQSIRDYGWSNTLLFDLLHNKYYKL
jgi:hypothetical protein